MNNDNSFEMIPTKAALLGKKQIEFKSIVFQEPARRTSSVPHAHVNGLVTSAKPKETLDKGILEFDIKKARHDIINFAISGQQPKNKRKMEIQKAVELGAKPPKKPYKNYKLLLEEKQKAKKRYEERLKFHQLGKNQIGAPKVKCSQTRRQREKQKKRSLPVNQIGKHYGVVNPNLKRKK